MTAATHEPGTTVVRQEISDDRVWAERLIDPSRRWRWQDADEIALFAERDEPPFSEPWPDWRPDPVLAVPELREGWEEPCR